MKNNTVSLALITFVFAAVAGIGLFAQSQGSYIIDYGPNNPADPNGEDWIRERDNPNPIMQITLRRVEPGYDILKSMSAYSFGTNSIPTAQVESFDLWLDVDGDGKVTPGDSLLSSDDLVTFNYPSLPNWGQYEFENLDLEIDQVGVTLLFTLSLKVTVPQLRNFMMQLAGPKFANGAISVSGSGLSSTYHYTISSFAGVDLWGSLAVPAATALQGSIGHPILQFNIAPENDGGYTPTVTKFRCRGDAAAGHNVVASDVTQLRLYREHYTPNGVVDIHDDLLAAGATISGTFAWEFVLSAPILLQSGVNLLVVADIGTNPSGLNHVFRMTMTRSDVVNNGTILAQGGVPSILEDAQVIKAPVAVSLVMVNQPTNVGAGLSLGPVGGLRVEARTGAGAIDTSFSSAVYAEVFSGPGNFTSQSVTAVQASAGVAIFNLLAIGTVGNYTIRFVSTPIPASAPSNSFTVTHGLAYRLTIDTQPADGEVGLPIPPPPVVHVVDFYDNLVLTFNGQVTANLSANPSGGTLQNGQATAVNGVATFTNLQLNKAGAGYSLIFTSAGIAASGGSDYFAMAVGAPAQLVVTQQPASVAGGMLIVPLPRVQVQDAGGNLVSAFVGDMAVSIGFNPSSGTLSGTLLQPVSNGVALFTDLSINFAGANYTLSFSINGGAVTGQSNQFDIFVGQAAKLGIVSQPTDTTGGMAFAPSVVVEVQDAGGNVIASDDSSDISAAITPGSGEAGAVLMGATTIEVVDGVATFADLAVSKCGPTPYTITFTSSGAHTGVISSSFIISLGPIARVGLATQPGLASYGAAFLQQPRAQLQDLGGNLVTGGSANISVSILAGSGTAGATLGGTANMFTLNGEAQFTGLSIDFAGVDYVLVFASAGLFDGLSLPFNVASPATQLALSVQPSLSQIGLALTVQPVIEIRDDANTLVPDNFTLVTVEIAPSTGTSGAVLAGTTQLVATNGVAAFSNLRIDTAGKGYRLKFTCYPALTQAVSDAFDVAGSPVKLVITRQPVGGHAGESLQVQPVVQVCDAADVVCVGENTVTVNAYITPATGSDHAILLGTNPVTVAGGVATFTDLGIDRPGQGYRLSFSSMPSFFGETTDAIDILGESAPSNNSDTAITAGVDGGSCTSGAGATPWLLLAALATLALLTRLATLPKTS